MLSSQLVGFDSLTKLLESVAGNQAPKTFPPYNLIQIDEDTYRIELALAGFAQDDLKIETEGDKLRISATPATNEDEGVYYHRGIALRSFSREFLLAPHIKVTNASYTNGLLVLMLQRETPEALKPRTIAITTGSSTDTTDHPTPA